MEKNIRDLLEGWPKSFIQDADLMVLLDKTGSARHSLVKRFIRSGLLIRIKRGLYLIASKVKRSLPDEFELSLLIYGPSFVSLESALSYHGWIPEAVYTTTCVSTKRAKEFKTPIGVFNYKHVPAENFYVGVDRIETGSGVLMVATPWRAIADFIYTRHKSWKKLIDIELDFRIDKETMASGERETLELLIEHYPSRRVRENLKLFLKELLKINFKN